MQVAATLRYARISPQKCRLVADVIRGKSVDDALRTLTFSPKKSARIVKKVLESAVANASGGVDCRFSNQRMICSRPAAWRPDEGESRCSEVV